MTAFAPTTLEILTNASHIIISDRKENGKRILINAQKGKLVYIKGEIDFNNNASNFIYSDIESIAVKNIMR